MPNERNNTGPCTKFLCDLIRMQQGQLTMADIRKAWTDGKYRGVKAEWAKFWMEQMQ